MNKYFLVLLLLSQSTCVLPQEEQKCYQVESNVETEALVSLILAFDALRHVAKDKSITPYSAEYIDHICTDKFRNFIVSVLKSKHLSNR